MTTPQALELCPFCGSPQTGERADALRSILKHDSRAATLEPAAGVSQLDRLFIGAAEYVRADEAMCQIMALQKEAQSLRHRSAEGAQSASDPILAYRPDDGVAVAALRRLVDEIQRSDDFKADYDPERPSILQLAVDQALEALSAAPKPPEGAVPETIYKAVERVLDEHSAWIARPNAEVTKRVALAAGIAWSLHLPIPEGAVPAVGELLADLEREAHATRDTAGGNMWMHGKAVGIMEAVGRIEHALKTPSQGEPAGGKERKVIFEAAMHVLNAGTPGLSPTSRKVIANNIAMRVQRGLAEHRAAPTDAQGDCP